MYDRAFRRWKEFALSKHELSYLPANPMHVAVYLQYVLESTRSSSSVDTAFYSIKWAHKSAGLVSPTDNPLVNTGQLGLILIRLILILMIIIIQ